MPLEKVGTFVLTDESLDSHSERVLVKGVNLSRFKSNPVMFYNHLRTTPGYWNDNASENSILPIGAWKSIRKQDGSIVADAYIDFDDDFAAKIGRKIQSGVLNAVSIGLKALAVSDDPDDKVQGQKGLTITKAELMEASIVDVPANPNALIMSKVVDRKEIGGKEKEIDDDQVFVKTYCKIENTKTMSFNLIEWLKGKGKDVPTNEEEAVALFEKAAEKEEGETKNIDARIEELKTTIDSRFSALADQVSALAGKVADIATEQEEGESEEEKQVSEMEQKMKALADQINAIKGRKSGGQGSIDPPPAIGDNKPDDGGKGKIKGAIEDVLSLIN